MITNKYTAAIISDLLRHTWRSFPFQWSNDVFILVQFKFFQSCTPSFFVQLLKSIRHNRTKGDNSFNRYNISIFAKIFCWYSYLDKNEIGMAYDKCYKACPFFFRKQKINSNAKKTQTNKKKITIVVVIIVTVFIISCMEHLLYFISQKC